MAKRLVEDVRAWPVAILTAIRPAGTATLYQRTIATIMPDGRAYTGKGKHRRLIPVALGDAILATPSTVHSESRSGKAGGGMRTDGLVVLRDSQVRHGIGAAADRETGLWHARDNAHRAHDAATPEWSAASLAALIAAIREADAQQG